MFQTKFVEKIKTDISGYSFPQIMPFMR